MFGQGDRLLALDGAKMINGGVIYRRRAYIVRLRAATIALRRKRGGRGGISGRRAMSRRRSRALTALDSITTR